LIPVNSSTGIIATQIEDILDPEIFLKTIKQYQNNTISSIINDNSYNKFAQCTHNIIDFKEPEREALKDF
jgi:hypothetical protein